MSNSCATVAVFSVLPAVFERQLNTKSRIKQCLLLDIFAKSELKSSKNSPTVGENPTKNQNPFVVANAIERRARHHCRNGVWSHYLQIEKRSFPSSPESKEKENLLPLSPPSLIAEGWGAPSFPGNYNRRPYPPQVVVSRDAVTGGWRRDPCFSRPNDTRVLRKIHPRRCWY
ncbi:hypothetical protein CEXT_657001 [Caerostris extrusa]|uniref:Uncharacterized protein n=1 Tax=Caerostris extrusa TaxID=172846 RepID=A0AAV4M7W1_CAEEX|nr:hypothetical protein CEXT_657001 [Caerostris extrusa]